MENNMKTRPQVEEKGTTRDAATQTNPGYWVEKKPAIASSDIKVTKPKSELGYKVGRMIKTTVDWWNSRRMSPDEAAIWNAWENALKEPVSQEQKEQKPSGSSATIASALTKADVSAPPRESMEEKVIAPTVTRCDALKNYFDDLHAIGYAAGTSISILPLLFGYCALQAQEKEKDSGLVGGLGCLAIASSAFPGTGVGLACDGLGLFAVPYVACTGKEPQFVKDLAERTGPILGKF